MASRTTIAVACAALAVVAACLAVVLGVSGRLARDRGGDPVAGAPPGQYERIVSMVPSVTEVLFALKLGDRVIGVTDYCTYPPEAQAKPRLGGFHDPNVEAIVALEPDVVITMREQQELRKRLEALGIGTLVVSQTDIPGIMDSISLIGERCGARGEAAALRAELERRLETVTRTTEGRARPRVLVCVDRAVGSGRLGAVCCAGGASFYDEIVTRAGGINALGDMATPYPSLSGEGLIRLDPDVILDVVPDAEKRGVNAERAAADWDELAVIKAVKARGIHVLAESYGAIPGPRFILLLERIARLLHPDAPWGSEP